MIPTTVIGSYPVKLNGGRYAAGYHEGIHSDASSDALKQAVDAQVACGIDIVSDGQTRGDFVKIFARNFSGVVIQERPVVLKEVDYVRLSTVEDQKEVRRLLPEGVELKGIITGPYTMAKSSENRHYRSVEDLAFAYAEGLAKEAEALDDVVDYVQVDEPYFSVDYPEYARRLTEMVFSSVKSPRMLHVCGDISGIFKDLVDYKVDYLEHEFAANPRLWDTIKDMDFKQILGVGVVRSDINKAESVAEVEARMNTALKHVEPTQLMFNPDCGLRNLDPEIARAKLKNMVTARDKLIKS
jgi:5-methyltetrahydropteroyltriglutamate--homocysteine methyltransferase